MKTFCIIIIALLMTGSTTGGAQKTTPTPKIESNTAFQWQKIEKPLNAKISKIETEVAEIENQTNP